MLGHDYDETVTEREREERGSEVVVTIREIEECARCGKTSVVTENKEVTSIVPESEPAAVDVEPDDDSGTDDVEPATVEPVATEPDTTARDPEQDDGVILDDGEDDEVAREYGEWPEREEIPEAGPAESEAQTWPDAEGEDEGYAAEQATGEEAEIDFSGGLTPEAGGDDVSVEDDAEFIEAVEDNSQVETDFSSHNAAHEGATANDDSGFVRSTAAPNPGTAGPDTVTDLVCPRCDFTQRSAGSSLRAGDICPECHRGYLSERES